MGSVERAVGILKSFSWDNYEMGLSEISRKNSLPKSTTHRVLKTLEKEGFINQNKTNGKYRLGTSLVELGNIASKNIELRRVALPYIEKLSRESRETVHLGILRKDEMVVVEASPSKDSPLRVEVSIGTKAPLYCTGTGKATLAFQPKEEISRILKKKRKVLTENTIVDKERLLEELQRIRKRGYAVDNMEYDKGIRCIAAPIRDHSGRVLGALSVSGPAVRITKESISEFTVRVKKVAEKISSELGYNLVVKEEG